MVRFELTASACRARPAVPPAWLEPRPEVLRALEPLIRVAVPLRSRSGTFSAAAGWHWDIRAGPRALVDTTRLLRYTVGLVLGRRPVSRADKAGELVRPP